MVFVHLDISIPRDFSVSFLLAAKPLSLPSAARAVVDQQRKYLQVTLCNSFMTPYMTP